MTLSRSDPKVLLEGDEILKRCVSMEIALLDFPNLSSRIIYKAALYGAIRTPTRGLYYMPDIQALSLRKWTPQEPT
jgi:hypothetical protein